MVFFLGHRMQEKVILCEEQISDVDRDARFFEDFAFERRLYSFTEVNAAAREIVSVPKARKEYFLVLNNNRVYRRPKRKASSGNLRNISVDITALDFFFFHVRPGGLEPPTVS